jgi:rod shape determining protein RodA
MLRTKKRFSSPGKNILTPWQHMDWWLLSATILLTFLGGLVIRSAQLNRVITEWWQHWIFGMIGVAIVFGLSRIHYDNFRRVHWYTYGLNIALLIVVLVIGKTTNGAQSWILIAGFQFQPSEFAKLGIIITLAAILHKQGASTLGIFLKTLAITSVPWGLILLQPDLGTSLVFGAINLVMLYWANAHPGWLFLLASPLVSAILYNVPWDSWIPVWCTPAIIWTIAMGFAAWISIPKWISLPRNVKFLSRFVFLNVWFSSIVSAIIAIAVNILSGQLGHILWGALKQYQKNRLIMFLNPEQDPLGAGYHIIQSRIAIGAGQLWGKGLNQGTQTQLNFIPEQHTDFVFSAIGEEFGFIGSVIVLLVFWLVCFRLLSIAKSANDNFSSLIAIGFLAMILFQTIINIGMTMGIAPITGIPLPWITYGRSSLLSAFIGVGLVESVMNFRRRRSY